MTAFSHFPKLTCPQPDVVWRAPAEAIKPECLLCFDPATGWGHWAEVVPGHEPVFLGFIRVDPLVSALADLRDHTLIVHRATREDGFRVTTEDQDNPQWGSWLVLREWTREGWREARLQSGLAWDPREAVSGHAL